VKTSHFSLIFVSAFLFGCASTTPKVSSTVKVDAWAVFFAPLGPVQPDQFQLLNDPDLDNYPTNFVNVIPKVFDCSPPPRSRIVESSVGYGRRDMSLIDDVNPPPIDLK
jgi:hypothetical protein